MKAQDSSLLVEICNFNEAQQVYKAYRHQPGNPVTTKPVSANPKIVICADAAEFSDV